MTFSATFIRVARNILPMPFTIAVVLTFVTMALALALTHPAPGMETPYPLQIGGFWERGFWDLLEFAMQMMLVLVLGHVLALTGPVNRLIRSVVRFCNSTVSAAAVVTLATITVALFNWGLGLIFGAILARKAGEHALARNIRLNYPLIGAAGYSGLMVWHGGLSGSAPLKVAEPNHFLADQLGVIPLTDTIFSPMNLAITLALLIALPTAMAWLGAKIPEHSGENTLERLSGKDIDTAETTHTAETPAEKLDDTPVMGWLLGGVILGMAVYRIVSVPNALSLNMINFILFGLGLVLFGSFRRYVAAVDEAVVGAAGIMIQFPLYAGIAGIMKYSGLIDVFSDFLVNNATPLTFPVFTFFSAGIVNVFVPSGGGQWAVQGPIIAEAAAMLNVSYAKSVMALAYGDQITNMLQPFWALPLLGITRLRAQEILPYSIFLMLVGGVIIVGGLLLF